MAGFDIRSILDFNPPQHICPNCRGLFGMIQHPHDRPGGAVNWTRAQCPICSSEFIEGAADDPWRWKGDVYKYLESSGHAIKYGPDLFDHARTLAVLVREAESKWSGPWPTMRLFFEVLARSKYFVHFASWGISHLMIGAFKVTSMRTPVFGFVSNVFESARVELADFPTEAPRLKAHVIQPQEGRWDAPHQKLVIIDGLLAFKGSTNLTKEAMRAADRNLDLNEVVTDFAKVAELNNRYFAPVWKKLTNPATDEIHMNEPPF